MTETKTRAMDSAHPKVTSESNQDWQVSAVYSEGGINKREYFAAMAMQGIIAAGAKPYDATKDAYNSFINGSAERATNLADALIEALNKGGGDE